MFCFREGIIGSRRTEGVIIRGYDFSNDFNKKRIEIFSTLIFGGLK